MLRWIHSLCISSLWHPELRWHWIIIFYYKFYEFLNLNQKPSEQSVLTNWNFLVMIIIFQIMLHNGCSLSATRIALYFDWSAKRWLRNRTKTFEFTKYHIPKRRPNKQTAWRYFDKIMLDSFFLLNEKFPSNARLKSWELNSLNTNLFRFILKWKNKNCICALGITSILNIMIKLIAFYLFHFTRCESGGFL